MFDQDLIPKIKILRKVSFVYYKGEGTEPAWRNVDVTEEDDVCISGMENGKYKKFLLSKIVGGKDFVLNIK